MNTQTVTLDVSKQRDALPVVRIRQGDVNGTTVEAYMYDDGAELDLTGRTVKFVMRAPGGSGYYDVDGTASGNVATFLIDETYAGAVSGTTDNAYVQVLENGVVCSTGDLRVVVLRDATEGVDPSAMYDNGLNEAIERATEAAEAAEGIVLGAIPTMSATVKGGAKLGAGLQMTDGVLSLSGGDIGSAVDDWLDDHPEATTTVQDNSVTDAKLVQTGGVLSTAKETKARLQNYVAIQNFDVQSPSGGGGVTVDVDLIAGYPVVIEVTDIVRTAGIQMFVEGHNTPSVVFTSVGKKTFTPTYDGKARFYFSAGSNSIKGSIYSTTRFDAAIDYLMPSDAVISTPSVQTLQIKKNVVFDSVVTHPNKYVLVSNNTTIANYDDFLTTSSVQTVTEPIRVRDTDGSLIYKNLHLSNAETMTGSRAMLAFGKDGLFLREVTVPTLASRSETFLSDEYFAIFSQYSNYPSVSWVVDDLEIEWLNKSHSGDGGAVYHVGASGDWQTFTDMLIALEDDASKKTVYVEGGVYDIFEEMGGADYIATIADPSNTNWRDVCHVVSPNTTIIGVGDVTLQWTPDAESIGSQAMAFLFSPLNVSGTCHIENINIRAKNARYAIHDEMSALARYNGSKHTFKKVTAVFEPSTYSTTYAYGAGHNKNCEFVFEDCYFESAVDKCWSTHDQPGSAGAYDASSYTFKNCVFKVGNNYSLVQFQTSDTVGRLDKIRFDGCQLLGVRYVNAQNYQALQGYEVTAMCCNNFTESAADNVTYDKPAKRYLTIS